MLIKFLSFVVSVIGTARYKTIFLSSLALILAFSTVTVTALMHNGPDGATIASTVVNQVNTSIDELPSLPLVHRSHPKPAPTPSQPNQNPAPTTPSTTSTNTSEVQSATTQTPSTSSTTNTNSDTSTQSNATVVATSTSVTLTPNGNPQTITLTMSDKSSVNWSVTVPNDPAVHILPSSTTTSTSFSIQISADQNAVSGTTDQLTVTATDTTRNINTSQIINIVIK